MLGTLKKRKSDKAKQLYNAIYEKVTRKTHKYESPQDGDGTLTKCIGFFKDGADPNILSELEKSLIEQKKHYDYYINKFLPTLKDEVIKSEELSVPAVFNSEIEQPQRPQTIKGKIVGIILGITNKENDKNHPNNTIRNQGPENSGTNSKKELEKLIETPKLNGGPGSRASSPVLSEKSPPSSPVSGRRDSISTTLSSGEEDGHPQKEEFEQQKQNPEEKPKKQENENSGGQVYPAKEEQKIPVSATLITDDDHTKDPVKSKETERKNTIVQKPFANGNNSEDTPPEKQPNNRNFIPLATCCALSVGCLIAGVVTLGMVGAGLLVMSVVFAIAAAVTRYLTPPSSKFTSTDLSPLIDDSKQR
ncbi:MAG: hypothetical protein LKM45_05810 [Wolbachia endosymbiont of Alcedoecus sp.]|nr:hypothetical protein [Wolbachia endosymbiont of Alcedoecus sp.]